MLIASASAVAAGYFLYCKIVGPPQREPAQTQPTPLSTIYGSDDEGYDAMSCMSSLDLRYSAEEDEERSLMGASEDDDTRSTVTDGDDTELLAGCVHCMHVDCYCERYEDVDCEVCEGYCDCGGSLTSSLNVAFCESDSEEEGESLPCHNLQIIVHVRPGTFAHN